ncbi:hypothetical protein DFR49_4217 [Hephaestia caeni]|uniref:Uncharacterized protein n=1 Tax=Hephaestia caeni TaxID=645617 RepID=A0A397NDA7_9SPHN|nr:hypothetical protein [Hephaestia caeni]RIA35440.1 hypothetical protein DFR49_4217 [Hephaestia caeni]
MNRIFEHFHLSLIEGQQDLFKAPLSREQWLREAFGETFSFHHYGKQFHWVPRGDSGNPIVGTVERKKTRTQHKGPEEGAAEFEGEEWQGSIVIIDPQHRPDGQKLAFERDPNVGAAAAVLDSLVAHLNSQRNQYTIHVKSLFDADTFRTFASRHGQIVRYVTFDFVVPNMFFGTSTSIDAGLRRIGEDTKAQGVKVTLESATGVDTASENVESALQYAEAGNASVTARAMNGDKYSSTSRRKTVKMHSILNFAKDSKEHVKQWLNQALGREADDSVGDADSAGDGPDRG